jgi:UDP-N-acetylglucosamine 2-epimerase (non-hydrolysing)
LLNFKNRPITVEVGTNTVVDLNLSRILENVEKILRGNYKKGEIPKLWDGKTAKRIIEILKNESNINI